MPRAKSKPKEPTAEPVVAPVAQPKPSWRDPSATFADDDNSIDARMWRTYTKGRGLTK